MPASIQVVVGFWGSGLKIESGPYRYLSLIEVQIMLAG